MHHDQLEARVLMAADVSVAAGPAVALHVNAGGGGFTDSQGRTFAADAGFAGGRVAQSAVAPTNTPDGPLFTSYRVGESFAFAAAVADGDYTLWLEMADPVSTAAGQRVFDVWAEGTLAVDDYDVFARAGAGKAAAVAVDVGVSGGELNLTFDGEVGEALVSAIVLLPTDPPADAAPYSWDAMSDDARQLTSQFNLRNLAHGLISYANDNRGRYPHALWTVVANGSVHHRYIASPRTATELPRGELSVLERGAWAEVTRDYLYLGSGQRTVEVGPDEPLAYENPKRVGGDINVLMGDHSVRRLTRAAAAALIGFVDAPPTEPPPVRPTPPAADPAVVQGQVNMRAILNALLTFANEHAQSGLPQSLGYLYANGYVTDINTFINPRSPVAPPPAEWTTQQKADWIDAHGGYRYFGAGRRLHQVGEYGVLLSERTPTPAVTGGLNVGFGDGRVEYREARWARETLIPAAPPAVIAGRFDRDARAVTLQFTEDVSGTLAAGDVQVVHVETNQAWPLATLSYRYDPATHTATFVRTADLPDGNYRLTLPAAAVTDVSGRPLAATYTLDFHFLSGDFNGDRAADFADLGILLNNYNTIGKFFSEGDANYDGSVDFADLGILLNNYNKVLEEPVRAGVEETAALPPKVKGPKVKPASPVQVVSGRVR